MQKKLWPRGLQEGITAMFFDPAFSAALDNLLFGQAAQTTKLIELETLRIEREIALEKARIEFITAGRESFERWLADQQAKKLDGDKIHAEVV